MFHLRCISPEEDSAAAKGELGALPGTDDDSYVPVRNSLSVSTKVTRAALLRDKVEKGCKICSSKKDEDDLI